MPVLIDSCVYLDVFTRDRDWYAWSSNAIADAVATDMVVLNPIIYAEISIRFTRIEELEAQLPQEVFQFWEVPREAAFLAGKCHLKYRARGGQKRSPLPDFFIGAHAMVENLVLITRDPRRFSDYFPKLKLLCP